jgi:hypothetical protein
MGENGVFLDNIIWSVFGSKEHHNNKFTTKKELLILKFHLCQDDNSMRAIFYSSRAIKSKQGCLLLAPVL